MINKVHDCPLCGCYVTRIRRRIVDRIINLFMPVYRYKCNNYHCQWVGNIRKQRVKQHLKQHTNTHA